MMKEVKNKKIQGIEQKINNFLEYSTEKDRIKLEELFRMSRLKINVIETMKEANEEN